MDEQVNPRLFNLFSEKDILILNSMAAGIRKLLLREIPNYPTYACFDASYALMDCFERGVYPNGRKRGEKNRLENENKYCLKVGSYTSPEYDMAHCWVEAPNGVIIDLTAGQFLSTENYKDLYYYLPEDVEYHYYYFDKKMKKNKQKRQRQLNKKY